MNSRFNLMSCGLRFAPKSRRHCHQIGRQTSHEIYCSVCVSSTILLTPCAPSTKSTSENDILSFMASDSLRTAWSCSSENRRIRLTDAPGAAWASFLPILKSVWVGHVFCNDCSWIVPLETQRPLQSWRKGVLLKHLSAPSIFSLFGWLEAEQWKQSLLNICKSRRFFTKTLITASLQSDSPQRIDALIDHMSAHTVTDYGAGKKKPQKNSGLARNRRLRLSSL